MTDVFVSDLFGYNIDNNSQFVIIYSTEIHKFLKKIAKSDDSSIWEVNRNKVDYLLKDRNVNPKMFLVLGDVFYKQNLSQPTVLILGNKSICKTPNSYEKVVEYDNGFIVKPINEQFTTQYNTIGLFYIKEESSLNYENIGLVPMSLILELDKITDNKIDVNDYNLLSVPDINGIKTIKKSEISQHTDKNIKLMNVSNKYLTMIDNDNEQIAKSRTKLGSSKQTLSYNAQGELITDGKCLTYNKNNDVYFEPCNNNKTQKWNILNDKVKPQYKYDSCLSSSTDNDIINIQQCANNDEQSWNTESSDVTNSSDYVLPQHNGKSIVLVSVDSPFYLNTDVTTPMAYKKDELNLMENTKIGDIKEVIIPAHAEPSKFVLDINSPHLGYGHSYASRQGTQCTQQMIDNKFDNPSIAKNAIEGFNGGNKSNDENVNMQIILILLLIILIIAGYYFLSRNL